MRGIRRSFYFHSSSPDCKYHSKFEFERNESRRCNCVKYLLGRAADGTRLRESTGTTSWEKARNILARKISEHDPVNRPLFNLAASAGGSSTGQRQTMTEATSQFLDMKPGENIIDMAHYVGFFEGELLKWCRERGHVLPKGLPRIRYFGWLANRRRRELLPLCRRLLAVAPPPAEAKTDAAAVWQCPICGSPMRIVEFCSEGV